MNDDMTPEERAAAMNEWMKQGNAAHEARRVLEHITELTEQYVTLYRERYPNVPPLRARAQAVWEVVWVIQSEMRAEMQRRHQNRAKPSDSTKTEDGKEQ